MARLGSPESFLTVLIGASVLLSGGCSTNELHVAARDGNMAGAQRLIRKGTDVNATDKYGNTPLHIALKKDNTEIAALLIGEGADINAKTRYGDTPLTLAAGRGHKDIVSLLISKGANIEGALSEAVSRGHKDIVEMLISKDANIEGALFIAVSKGHKDIVEMLISRGADVNCTTKSGNTPLHEVAASGHTDIASLLIDEGAELNPRNQYGRTPLHEAYGWGKLKMVDLLISKGADVSARDNHGRTPESVKGLAHILQGPPVFPTERRRRERVYDRDFASVWSALNSMQFKSVSFYRYEERPGYGRMKSHKMPAGMPQDRIYTDIDIFVREQGPKQTTVTVWGAVEDVRGQSVSGTNSYIVPGSLLNYGRTVRPRGYVDVMEFGVESIVDEVVQTLDVKFPRAPGWYD